MAKEIMAEYEEKKETSRRKRDLKKYRKAKEDALMDKFEEELKNLTVSEGKNSS